MQRITLTIDKSTAEALKCEGKRDDRTISSVVRRAVFDYFRPAKQKRKGVAK